METSKLGLASALVHIGCVSAQTEKRMDIQAPLTAVYIHTVPALPAQSFHLQSPVAAQEPATLHMAMPPLYSKETLPFLTLHIPGGVQSQPGPSLAASVPAARPKSAGKHVCPHCGRDCMKPSVLEKHLRCHTGERPYPCITCGVSFKTQSNLYKHKRTQAHARLSSESEPSSLDSNSGSRDTCTSSLSIDDRSKDQGSMGKETISTAAEIDCPAIPAKVYSVKTQGSLSGQHGMTSACHRTQVNETEAKGKEVDNQKLGEKKPWATASGHFPLQRQEATLYSKQWENSVSQGKSQSHESTDSGFSESSEHYPSPASVLPDHSMDSLTVSSKEHQKETTRTQTPSGPGRGGLEPRCTAKEQEQKTLEERISKLISENTAVVEDKQLEHVRPRKTVLSKQGSIDLPMPYRYKDSFQFDMRISKAPNVGSQRSRHPGFYSSVPTQQSNTLEHAPLTRSNSLPYSVTLLPPDRSSPTSSFQSDYVTVVRKGSCGQINPTGFAMKPVNQHSSAHRPLVRQTAVDGHHATDGLFTNSSVEEACASSLSCDGDGGDICGEPSNRKFRRKKAQKFAYDKWYMYGGGTFKKLYNTEKGSDESVSKSRKCLANKEHEVVQSLPKRLLVNQKDTATTINSTTSSAIACQPGLPPAKLNLFSAVDWNVKAGQVHASCSSLKTPLRRNRSLSVLPLFPVGSLVSNQTKSMSRAEKGTTIDREKHTDSKSPLCRAQVPSDMKKQKTDDKIICPLEMETEPTTPPHPCPLVTCSAPQQDTSTSYINLQKNQTHTQLTAALFPTCIISTNTASVSCSSATFTSAPSKASFLPKYQLKLPNAAEPGFNTSLRVVDKPPRTGSRTITSALSSFQTGITSLSVKTWDRICEVPRPTSEIIKTNAFSSTEDQLTLPCTATTLCRAEMPALNKNAAASALVHQKCSATTITTTCLQNVQAGLCSTSIQPSQSPAGSPLLQLPRPVSQTVPLFPPTTTIAASNNPPPAAVTTAFAQGQPNLNPLSITQLSPASGASNSAYTTPVVPCHIVPFDQMQPDARNVFHVHTADLQICFQIISDEQLALIEPQIERQAGRFVSQRRDVEVIQNLPQSCIAIESSNEGRGIQPQGHQQGFDQSESSLTFDTKRIKPQLSAQFGAEETNFHLDERDDSPQETESAESPHPGTLGTPLRPHRYNNVNTATVTQSCMGDIGSTAASLTSVESEGSQTSDREQTVSPTCCAEGQLLRDRRVSQGKLMPQTVSGQHKFSDTPLSPSTVNLNNSETVGKENNLKNQGAPCSAGTVRAMHDASVCRSDRSETGEPNPPLQIGLGQAFSASRTDEHHGAVSSFPINKCISSRQLNPHTSTCCSNPTKTVLSEALDSCKKTNMACDNKGQDENSSADTEQQLAQFMSMSSIIQVERAQSTPAELPSIQSHPAGLKGGCAAQKELHTLGHGGTPGKPDSPERMPKPSQGAGRTSPQCVEGEDGNGGVNKNKAKSTCTLTRSPDMLEEEDRAVNLDPTKHSRLSERHLQHFSHTHSGMSECPPRSPQRAQSALNSPARGGQTGLSPPPQVDTDSFAFSQQLWGSSSSSIRNQQASCESSLSERVKARPQETQNGSSRSEPAPRPTPAFPQRGTAPAQQGHADVEWTAGSPKSPGVSPDSHSAQVRPAGTPPRSNSSVLDAAAGPPSQPFTFPQPDGHSGAEDGPPEDFNKFFFPAECLSSGARPLQSCMDLTEDTSSSDDEGKLIIEL
ncbi:zinc finger protein 831 [Pungitius pungitius]|uniref:zinc finger protein 831 n=1 Tax=Pungitius pungitius TaxID=134920 RepID=UPI002E0D7976